MIRFLKKSPAAGYASEEQEGHIDFKNNNNFIVFADPLDGSSNIDVNVSIGTIFSIMSKNNLPLEKAFIQNGSHQKSSGFFVYGPQTTLFITVGVGTSSFALDEKKGKFIHEYETMSDSILNSTLCIENINFVSYFIIKMKI